MRQWLVHLAVMVLMLLTGGCYREYADTGGGQPYRGTAPWTIEGVRPGMTLDEITARLGPPKENPYPKSDFRQWGYPREVTVSFDREMRATDVVGVRITAEERTLVYKGQNGRDVVTVLGKGASRKHYRPKGSGVISIGMSYTGRDLRYDNGAAAFEIGLSEQDDVKYVRATPLKKQ